MLLLLILFAIDDHYGRQSRRDLLFSLWLGTAAARFTRAAIHNIVYIYILNNGHELAQALILGRARHLIANFATHLARRLGAALRLARRDHGRVVAEQVEILSLEQLDLLLLGLEQRLDELLLLAELLLLVLADLGRLRVAIESVLRAPILEHGGDRAAARLEAKPLPFGGLLRQVPHVRLVHAHEHVLGLHVRVNDLALAVEIVESLEDLFDDEADILERYAVVVGLDYELEQIVAEHFEDHADVDAVRAGHFEVVEQLDGFEAILVVGVAVAATLEQLDFVGGRFGVVFSRFDYFERDEAHCFEVPAQPHGGEVAPAELAQNVVALVVQVADFDGVVAAFAVVGDVFLLLVVRADVVGVLVGVALWIVGVVVVVVVVAAIVVVLVVVIAVFIGVILNLDEKNVRMFFFYFFFK